MAEATEALDKALLHADAAAALVAEIDAPQTREEAAELAMIESTLAEAYARIGSAAAVMQTSEAHAQAVAIGAMSQHVPGARS